MFQVLKLPPFFSAPKLRQIQWNSSAVLKFFEALMNCTYCWRIVAYNNPLKFLFKYVEHSLCNFL